MIVVRNHFDTAYVEKLADDAIEHIEDNKILEEILSEMRFTLFEDNDHVDDEYINMDRIGELLTHLEETIRDPTCKLMKWEKCELVRNIKEEIAKGILDTSKTQWTRERTLSSCNIGYYTKEDNEAEYQFDYYDEYDLYEQWFKFCLNEGIILFRDELDDDEDEDEE